MSKNDKSSQLHNLVNIYLDNSIGRSYRDGQLEFEIRFGTKRGYKKLTRINYENVIKRLLFLNFKRERPEHFLRIMSEYIDINTGITRISNVRTKINGIHNVLDYCRNNSLRNSNDDFICEFEQKSYMKDNKNKNIYPIDFDDFNFRASLQLENNISYNSKIVKEMVSNWNDKVKIFRYINRCSLINDNYPLRVDVSIVKSSKDKSQNIYKFLDSKILDSEQEYEIEIELEKNKIGPGTKFDTADKVTKAIREVIKIILSGIQSTNYPISISEQEHIKMEYMKILWGKDYQGKYISSKNFVGPSSYTLQMENIIPINKDLDIPNINESYTVTDKADGDRKLLFISSKGKIYLIDTNMNIQFTGAKTNNNELVNSIVDGEHILNDKKGNFINLYAAFDIYYINGNDVRGLEFSSNVSDNLETKLRLPLLTNFIKKINSISIINDQKSPIRIERKKFYLSNETNNIFNGCNTIISNINKNIYEYETDGLIFTPSNIAVGGSKDNNISGKPNKKTWEYSFKWKPQEFNTIDFLVTIKKDERGEDLIQNMFKSGKDMSNMSQLKQYKTVILRVGFDEKQHGYINPCQNIIDDNYNNIENKDNSDNYRPLQFYPTDPVDNEAGICNIYLKQSNTGDNIMLTEENEIIENNTIVEFKYDKTKDRGWNWVPLKVRYDKTAEFRSGGRNYGNPYHVANSNWHTIHNPITEEMITTGNNIPDDIQDNDVYYRNSKKIIGTNSLKDFHNKVVKRMLITNISEKGDILIDLAVGKGGDISKWISAELKFVFGIDISRDNIENRKDGICARYINNKKKKKNIPKGLFVHGNASVNIRNTDGIYTDKDKQIVKAIFGEGAKDVKELGKGVYNAYGIGQDGFDICSIQFALHYMFEDQQTLQNFLRNVSETTKVGGYFIGTSYDGHIIYDKLLTKKKNESIVIVENDIKLWGVTKKYDRERYNDDSSCVGYAIDVYQDSINKTAREYLVNYKYLTRVLENYGFVLAPIEEVNKKNLPSNTGFFSDIFKKLENDKKKNKDYGNSSNMTIGEKNISFLNRYFIYKKIRNVNAKEVAMGLLNKTYDDELEEISDTIKIINDNDEKTDKTEITEQDVKKTKTKRKRKKLVIKD
tara:strand:- start:3145 stop:6489 length:3345 start_codon:yes stop_codon:yes gene_type:complete